MTEKCDKYESLFIFGNDKDFQEHLKNCPDCQKEHMKMEQISSMVKEVKPFIKRKSMTYHLGAKVAASVAILIIGFGTFGYFSSYTQTASSDLDLVRKASVITNMGLPTDEYGLLMVEKQVDDES